MPLEQGFLISRVSTLSYRSGPASFRAARLRLEGSASLGSSPVSTSSVARTVSSPALPSAACRSLRDASLVSKVQRLPHFPKILTKHEVKDLFANLSSKESEDCRSLDQDVELSLVCPLTRTRMTKAAKFYSCKHTQCFDALSFMKTYELSVFVKCPICGNRQYSSELYLNEYVQEILEDPKTANVSAVTLRKDGNWEVGANTEVALFPKSSTLRRTDSKRGREPPRKQLVDVESNTTIFPGGEEDSDVEILDTTSELINWRN